MDLNRSKPFGEVFGTGLAYKYEQDGRLFNHEDYECKADGTLVTPAEKIARLKKEQDAREKEKKAIIDKELHRLNEEQAKCAKESRHLMIVEVAKNIDRLDAKPLSAFGTKADIEMALNLLEFPFSPNDKRDDLFNTLKEIFEAAY